MAMLFPGSCRAPLSKAAARLVCAAAALAVVVPAVAAPKAQPAGAKKQKAARDKPARTAAAVGATAAVAAATATAGARPAAATAGDRRKADCAALGKLLPRIDAAACEAAGLAPSSVHSVKGFPIYQRDVSSRSAAGTPVPARRRVFVMGGVHGDELSSSSLVFRWISLALENAAEMDWRFVPVVNPDGLLMRTPTRTNANGVDLNRNFPTPRWAEEAPKYWAERTQKDPRRWPGPAALSEPEVRFVVETMERWKPDLIVSVHAPYGVLDYDGPSVPPQRLGRLFLDRLGIFPGSLGYYGGMHKNVPVVTIELPSSENTPTEAEMRQIWIDLLRWTSERIVVSER